MQFRTQIPVSKNKHSIDYDSKVMSLGSCFAENISAKFDYFKFQVTTNPFGIIFNPVSIEQLINRVVNKIEYTEKDIFFHNDLWHCYEVHSELSNPNREEFLSVLNGLIYSMNEQLKSLTHLTITYGTSWVYRNIESNEIVANCHKVPQKKFTKELLSVEIIKKSIQNTLDLIQKINAKCQFILTVSPVRHIKDGFVENSVSKSNLITSLFEIVNSQPSIINYFPSYEIMMDELRDYRFYADDMLHPNLTAINYIWDVFAKTWISPEVFSVMNEVQTIQRSLAHQPFNPDSQTHQKFLQNLQNKIKVIQENHPTIRF